MLQARITKRNFGKAIGKLVEIDPHGPVADLFRSFAINPSRLSPVILAKMIRWIMGGKGRFQFHNEWNHPWYSNGYYVTRHETCLFGWQRCSNGSYDLFVHYRDASREERVGCDGRRGWWEYVPTDSIWQGLEPKDVIEHLSW